MNYATPIAALLCVFTLSGCASVTTSAMQPLSVTTKSKTGSVVSQAKCSLKNEKGEWSVVTPNTVSVHKAGGNLAVNCKKSGLPEGNARAISRAGAGMYGNIIIGGGIGALIDHSSGKAYNYPDKISVVMGDSITVDRHDPGAKNKEEETLGSLDKQGGNDSTDDY